MQQFDLIIVGGGLAGASLALALRDTRLRIALVEGQAPHRPELGCQNLRDQPCQCCFSRIDWRLASPGCLPYGADKGDAGLRRCGWAARFFGLRLRCFRIGLDTGVVVDGCRILGKRKTASQPDPVVPCTAR